MKAKLLSVSVSPFKVVHQGPREVSFDRDCIELDRFQHLVNVVLVVVYSLKVVQIPELGLNTIYFDCKISSTMALVPYH